MCIRDRCSRILNHASHYYVDAPEVEQYLDYPAAQKNGRMKVPEIQAFDPAAEIIAALRRCGGSREQTAKELNISTSTLWRRMKKMCIRDRRWTDGIFPQRNR